MAILKFIKKYSFLIGLGLFAFIILRSDPGTISRNIKDINPLYLALATFTTLPMFLSRAWCWNYLKKQQGIFYKLKDSFLMYGAGQYVGLFTPGRVGEIAKAWYLKKDGHSLGKSLVSVIFDRISDLLFLLLFAAVGSLFFLGMIEKQILIPLFGLLALGVLFFIFLKIGLVRWAFKKAFTFLVPEKSKKAWKTSFQDFATDAKSYRKKDYLAVFSITSVSWFFYFLQMYLLARAINLEVPFLYLSIAVTVAGLVTLIPVSVSGIGTRDAALILLFAPLSIVQEQVIVFSALILLMFLLAALLGLWCWLIKPIRL